MLSERHSNERYLDVNVLKGAAIGMSDNFLEEASVKDCGGFKKRRNDM